MELDVIKTLRTPPDCTVQASTTEPQNLDGPSRGNVVAGSDEDARTAADMALRSSSPSAPKKQGSRCQSASHTSPNNKEGVAAASAVPPHRSARASKSTDMAASANLSTTGISASHPPDAAVLSNLNSAAQGHQPRDVRGHSTSTGAALSSMTSKLVSPIAKPRSGGGSPRPSARKGQRSGTPGTSRAQARRKKSRGKLFERFVLSGVVVSAGTLLAVAVLIILRTRKDDPQPTLAICDTPGCRKHAYELALAIDPSVEPCENFYGHTCGKWQRLFRLPFHYEMLLGAMLKTLDALKKESNASTAVGSVAAFFASCMNPKSDNPGAGVERFAAWKRSLGLLWPEQRQEATRHPLDVLLKLALRWNINLLFAVRIWRSREPRTATLFLDRGTLWDGTRRRRKELKLWGTYEGYVAAHCRCS
ncbi:hypothetical protein V5799_033954 [Amblyomma americanum]|uniref:Peptidase M13 N-terminal domain-containing protein n=1 Tax=Amblyomma americanum TaxID=6943 RepID=A0AAQ4DLU8_AMBAM